MEALARPAPTDGPSPHRRSRRAARVRLLIIISQKCPIKPKHPPFAAPVRPSILVPYPNIVFETREKGKV